jgi:hypothetical protein
VFLCRLRAAFDPAPAPVLGMGAADAAPGGGLLCADADADASASKRANPIEMKVALRMVALQFARARDGAGGALGHYYYRRARGLTAA